MLDIWPKYCLHVREDMTWRGALRSLEQLSPRGKSLWGLQYKMIGSSMLLSGEETCAPLTKATTAPL